MGNNCYIIKCFDLISEKIKDKLQDMIKKSISKQNKIIGHFMKQIKLIPFKFNETNKFVNRILN